MKWKHTHPHNHLWKKWIQSIFTTGFKPTRFFFTQLEGSLIKTEVDWKALAFSNKCSVSDKEITLLSKWMMRYLHFSACIQLYISRSLFLSISSWSETAANCCSWSCCVQGSHTGLFGICLSHVHLLSCNRFPLLKCCTFSDWNFDDGGCKEVKSMVSTCRALRNTWAISTV